MIIEQGTPPYKISSGKELPRNHARYSGAEQFASAENFEDAVSIIADLSDFGLDAHTQYIIDSKGTKILDMTNDEHVLYLRSIDKDAQG